MTIRERIEKEEKEYLSPYASCAADSKGRDRAEPQCDIRPVYQRDRDRILHSKAFRRLKDKTQVFLSPEGDHYRTRLTHTLEVSQNARTIAKALRLNEDLVEAIALGHDLGHTPFGHAGERALDSVCPYGFRHNEQSVRVVEVLEKDGKGLNLTKEVRDGILNHKTSLEPCTLEGKVVRYSDKIAYIYHDCDDAIRAGILKNEDIPESICKVTGYTTNARLDCFIHNIITNSLDKDDICMSPEVEEAMKDLRQFMFENVYTNKQAKAQEKKAHDLVATLYEYYLYHPDKLPNEYRNLMEQRGDMPHRVVCDYVSSMSDRYAVNKYRELFIPDSWRL
ncbi:MAG: deoxyguanosinetriphosphate triphosphohydrolase [Lachnospiraceae bacterium]|nr:deoxyguanosinetriphosphate triphosphohydrolase [Lachnospiraceae bacterium]MBR4175155.1 deoxyguanosinetriphosphate triphosphohydrolase [Lachnospiraceae bacterium]